MQLSGDQSGQTELVIVFPIAILLILFLLQAAMWFLGRAVAQDAAQDGARAAALLGGSPTAGEQAARDDLTQLAGPVLSSASVGATDTAGRAQVTVSGVAESILPGFSLNVSASAAEPIEEFRP
ncbi:MAG TPA: TadE/TadG family type IV pilus assembly protein [Acidimicrobiales bacterium]|nr:TadE/TadG family type IV pilus assembly protein [Acidimicrobiales bacterium]